MTLYALEGTGPSLPDTDSFWIAPDANLVGKVTISDDVSIWFGATLRGDNEPISVGEGSNIQDGCIIHTDPGFPCTVGKRCTVGHRAILHGCVIDDGCLVGMGATILNGARIGANSVVGACALVTEGKVFPEYSLLVGSPARVVRTLDEDEIAGFAEAASSYRRKIGRYQGQLERLGPDTAMTTGEGKADSGHMGVMLDVNYALEPGMLVRNPRQETWGEGQIQSIAGTTITVNFENVGKVVLNGAVVGLESCR